VRARQWGSGGEASVELVKPRMFLELRCLPLQLLISEGGVEVVMIGLPMARWRGRRRTTRSGAAPGIAGGDESTIMETCGVLHRGWGKVKIAVARWVFGDEVLLVSKEMVARSTFVSWPG
jgi:hypothetical protein